MSNLEKYNEAFTEILGIDKMSLQGGVILQYQKTDSWDSVGHMKLMAAIEDAFDIEFEMKDIIEFSSYEKGKEILARHNITI